MAILTLLLLFTSIYGFATSVDPDLTPQNAASDQDPHYDDRSSPNESRVSPSSPVRCETLHRNYFRSDCLADSLSGEGDKHNKHVNQSPQKTSTSPSSTPPLFQSPNSTGVDQSGDSIPRPLFHPPPAESPISSTSSSRGDCRIIKLIKDSSEPGDETLASNIEHDSSSVDKLTEKFDLEKGKLTKGSEPVVKVDDTLTQRGLSCCSNTKYCSHLSKSIEIEKQFSECPIPSADDSSCSGQLIGNKQTEELSKQNQAQVNETHTKKVAEENNYEAFIKIDSAAVKSDSEVTSDSLFVNKDALKSDSEATNDSLFVNKDTDSADTVNDTVDDLCTQYSLPDIDEGDVNVNETDNNSDVSVYENADSCSISKDISQSDFKDTEEFLKSLPSSVRIELQRKLSDKPEDRKQAKLRSLPLQKQVSESDSSVYDSFYSFENVTDCGLVPFKSKKALRWTPKILSESRFSSTFSSTFSDAASFYTAETSGTFYSAKSFQLDSCDNFQTCEDFQKITEEPKSKLSKAKDVLVRGKDFVKSKFENYKKRLPNWRKGSTSESGSRSDISCLHHPCGFSCVHLGKEISQYSIPESSCVKGDYNEVTKGDDSVVIEADIAVEDVRSSNADREAMLKKGAADEATTEHGIMGSGTKERGIMGSGTKERGIMGSGTKRGPTGRQKVYSIIADEEDDSESWSKPQHSRTVKMETAQREATEAEDDDMPVGTEALTIPRSRKPTENGDGDDRPSIKRLRWVSALEKTQESSLRSSLTSNSSVVELLQQREMDPETLLNNLGFGGGPHTDESANRIPERFLLNPVTTRGVNLYEFVVSNPELHHILPLWDRNPNFPRTVDPATLMGSPVQVNGGGGGDCGNQSVEEMLPKSTRGSMQRPNPFSSVFHGMKFLHNTQTPAPPSPDEEMKRISSIPSILDYANRKALAQQGFYGKQYVPGEGDTAAGREPAPGLGTRSQSMQGLNAAERRKHFHRTAKSKNWSLTNESEASNTNTSDQSISEESSESFDRGLILRSFSERFSSESSVESNDMYESERRQLMKQNSISNLRRQYEETIRNSVDRDSPVFDDLKATPEEKGRKTSISDIRKSQVNRLMSSLEDDGDYFAQSRQSSLKETESIPSLKLKQSSTQSGSPVTPRDFTFSFDSALHDGESEFDFSKSESPRSPVPGDTQSNEKPAVSIVVENGPVQENIQARVATVSNSSNPNELTPLSLVRRSDSSNTLVPQDSACDGENVEGEVTPRQGDITQTTLAPGCSNKLLRVHSLSESTGSTVSTATVVPKEDEDFMDTCVLPADLDLVDDALERSGEIRSRSPVAKDSLKPSLVCPPQESFELEEISSAENAYEDINGNLKHRKGHMEKSLSAHSDSSGFADIEVPGESSPGGPDAAKDIIVPKTSRRTFSKQKTFDSGHIPDDDSSLPVSQQTENSQRELTTERVSTVIQPETFLSDHDHDKTLFVCKKEPSLDSDKEIAHPTLSSISYIPDTDCDIDKAVVFTVNIPYHSNPQNEVPETKERLQKRFVSQVQMDIATKTESAIDGENDSNKPHFVLKGPVKHKEIRTDSDSKTLVDAETNSSDTELVTVETDIDSVESFKSNQRIYSEVNGIQQDLPKDIPVASKKAMECNQVVPKVVSGYETIGAFDARTGLEGVKHGVVSKKKSKEALIAANSHTAKWLLGNERHSLLSASKKSHHDGYSVGRPMWASSPNLDNENADSMDAVRNRRHLKKDGRHSLDLANEEAVEDIIQPGRYFTTDSIPEHQLLGQSFDDMDGYADDSASRRRFEDLRQDSVCSSMDESIVVPRRAVDKGNISCMPRDDLQYLKLSRLVSGPSLVLNPSTKMPTIQFTPNVHMKNWMQLPKQKHLEEETILMQHAVQRYRAELNVMETMLVNSCQQASSELNTEEREEVEELRHLWSEVQKEICKMDQLLSVRLSEVRAGNESYSPLDSLQIVQAMVDLLREQLYQQQMCINRDINFNEEEDRLSVCPSLPESTVSSTGLSELSQKVSDVQQMVSVSEQNQKQEMKKCLSELQSNLMSEVRSEISSTQNVKMLQLQLQARDNEVKRLKMELLLQGVETGSSRTRQIIESDV